MQLSKCLFHRLEHWVILVSQQSFLDIHQVYKRLHYPDYNDSFRRCNKMSRLGRREFFAYMYLQAFRRLKQTRRKEKIPDNFLYRICKVPGQTGFAVYLIFSARLLLFAWLR